MLSSSNAGCRFRIFRLVISMQGSSKTSFKEKRIALNVVLNNLIFRLEYFLFQFLKKTTAFFKLW